MVAMVGMTTVTVAREYVGRSGQVIVWEGHDLGDALERAMIEQATIGNSVRHAIYCDGTEGKIVVTGDAKGVLVLPNGQMLQAKVTRR